MPSTNSTPAEPRFEVIELIGPEKVSAPDSGPILVTMSVTVWVVDSGSANSPTIDTIAISIGNSDSSP